MDAASATEPPPKRKGNGPLILAIVTIVMIVVAIVMVWQRQPDVKGDDDAPRGVEITITAPRPGTPFTIDGAPAGKTPQAIKLRGRTKPLKIEGNGVVVEINPDRDRVVNLDPKQPQP